MVWQIAKLFISAGLISFTSWLASRQPKLAGFLLALPISSMLALLLFQAEYHDSEKAAAFAKSIFFAVPLSLLFFVPFLFVDRLKWPFGVMYLSGVGLLAIGYAIHSMVMRF